VYTFILETYHRHDYAPVWWRSCAKVREAIELLFGVVSKVGQGIGVLHGGPGTPSGRECFGGFLVH